MEIFTFHSSLIREQNCLLMEQGPSFVYLRLMVLVGIAQISRPKTDLHSKVRPIIQLRTTILSIADCLNKYHAGTGLPLGLFGGSRDTPSPKSCHFARSSTTSVFLSQLVSARLIIDFAVGCRLGSGRRGCAELCFEKPLHRTPQ